jgi:hypothetical protein
MYCCKQRPAAAIHGNQPIGSDTGFQTENATAGIYEKGGEAQNIT